MPPPTNVPSSQETIPLIDDSHPHKKRVKVIRWVLLAMVGLLVVVIALQLLFPTDRALPLTKVADVEIGGLTKREAVEKLFGVYGSAELTVTVDGKTIKTTTGKAGVLVDFQKAADAASRYPWWQRLVPFSILYKSQVINAKPELAFDEQLMKQFTKTVQEKCSKPVREASVAITDGKPTLQPGLDGKTCSEEAIRKGLVSAVLHGGVALAEVTATTIAPTKTTAIAQGQFDTAQAAIASGLTVIVGNERAVVPQETLASWVQFTDDTAKKSYTVTYDDAAIRKYLESRKQVIYVAPVATKVYVLDSVETHREPGLTGRDIDYDATVAIVKQSLQDKKGMVVTAKLKTILPSSDHLRTYSKSQHGLERLLADIVAGKGNYGVSVTELGGDGRVASANGDRKYVTASTYKLFVAYMVLKDLESGRLKWEDVIVGGLNVRQCFEEMIVRSANRCSVAYINRYGGQNIVTKMHELGFASVARDTTWWATPNDLARYMVKLERGELLQGESRDYLLGLLKRQIWRYGIPTGIKGVTIADKVGFLEDYIHDVAIVYSPKGTYILAVMTKGGSYGGIADVARRVHSYMNQ